MSGTPVRRRGEKPTRRAVSAPARGYRRSGEIGKAIPFYNRFVDVWKNADPDLQPKVAAVRAKLRAFAQTERR
jgi:hypothetical protein